MEILGLTLLAGHSALRRAKTIRALEAAGVVGPANARPLYELDVDNDDIWAQLVREGRIREASPGTFYLFERPRASVHRRVITAVVFAVLLIAPVVVTLLVTANQR